MPLFLLVNIIHPYIASKPSNLSSPAAHRLHLVESAFAPDTILIAKTTLVIVAISCALLTLRAINKWLTSQHIKWQQSALPNPQRALLGLPQKPVPVTPASEGLRQRKVPMMPPPAAQPSPMTPASLARTGLNEQAAGGQASVTLGMLHPWACAKPNAPRAAEHTEVAGMHPAQRPQSAAADHASTTSTSNCSPRRHASLPCHPQLLPLPFPCPSHLMPPPDHPHPHPTLPPAGVSPGSPMTQSSVSPGSARRSPFTTSPRGPRRGPPVATPSAMKPWLDRLARREGQGPASPGAPLARCELGCEWLLMG